ncbi:MAG TPA: type III pantothenate kinase [Woeseiaceae bacterium]|nr:type III pantothenate kinase [Woeseiaceae bacterium]
MSGAASLLFDAGNTRLKWGLYEDGHIGRSGSVTHDALRDTGYAALLTKLPRKVGQVLACNVAGASFATRLSAAIGLHCDADIRFVHSERRAYGVTNGYTTPRRLGVDRWVALIAAYAERHSAAVVVDAGTAVTIDVIDKTGLHLGGQILPGIRLMSSCLSAQTAEIPPQGRRANPSAQRAFANNTGAAVTNGAFNAVCGAIERAVHAARKAGLRPRIVLTGGDASSILTRLEGSVLHRPNLVLQGLAHIIDTES